MTTRESSTGNLPRCTAPAPAQGRPLRALAALPTALEAQRAAGLMQQLSSAAARSRWDLAGRL